VRPPLNYYGGKVRLAPWIASLLPPHRVYVEPFFGSGAVLFAKPPSPHELANDLDGDVVCFFRALRDRPEALVRACTLTPYHRAEYLAAWPPDTPGVDDLERARRFWVRSAQAFNKCLTHRASWGASAKRGASEATSAICLVERMHTAAQRLRRVVFDQAPAVAVIAKYAIPGAVVYCDPPYLAATRRSQDRGRRGDYAVEYASEAEHRELAAALHASPATVLLSGYPSALYEELYAGWWQTRRTLARPSTNQGGQSGPPAVEVIWSNRPLAGQLRLDHPAEEHPA
jgi:DNA adenine methylase